MSLTTGEMSAADLAAVVGGSRNNNDGFGGDGNWWIILLFLCLFNGGWGNNFGGGSNGGAGGLYPWMNQAEITSDGFRDQMINSGINSIRDGVSGLSNQLCNCCCDMQGTVQNGFAQAEIAANGRQMANMNQAFAAQTAMNQGFNSLQSDLASCCCENRLATADLKYTIATENCADRAALSDGVRDILANQTANTQRILDVMCQDRLDAKNDRISDLERQLTMANLAASQTAQTAQIIASQTAQTEAIYQRFATCPVGTVPVYGEQPIFTCNNGCGGNGGCGCGCA